MAQLVWRWSCQRWQTPGGGSNPCWSTRESQVRPAERQRAPTTKKKLGISNPSEPSEYSGIAVIRDEHRMKRKNTFTFFVTQESVTLCIAGMAKSRFPKTSPYWLFMVTAGVHPAHNVPSFYCMSLDHDGLLANAAFWPLPLPPFNNVMQWPCKHPPREMGQAKPHLVNVGSTLALGKRKEALEGRDLSHLTSEKSSEIMRNHEKSWGIQIPRAQKWTSSCKLMIPRWPGNSLRSKDVWATCEPRPKHRGKSILASTLRLGVSRETQDANSHKFTWSYMDSTWVLLGGPFWAKPVLRRFSGPRIGSVGASCFVDDFVSCWGMLEPSWR